MWKLAIEDDEGKQTVVPLTRDEYTIGRKDGNTIRLTERNVSREHARLIKKKPNGDGASASAPASPAIVLEDLTSYNGVFVNGLRVTHAQNLSHGDLVQIGDYRIVLQDEASPQAPGPSATPNDAKQTVPGAPAAHARANALIDRPNRLAMIAGTAPAAGCGRSAMAASRSSTRARATACASTGPTCAGASSSQATSSSSATCSSSSWEPGRSIGRRRARSSPRSPSATPPRSSGVGARRTWSRSPSSPSS